MFRTMKFLVLAIVVLVCSAPLLYADLSKAEEREVNSYRLSEGKISQFWQATKNLIAAHQENPKLFDVQKENNDEGQDSMVKLIEVTNNIPAAKKAIEDAGMTAKEYWTFQMAMVYASAGHMALKAGGKLPEGFSKENVEFYRAHEAEFIKMGDDLKALQKLGKQNAEEEETTEDEETEEEETQI